MDVRVVTVTRQIGARGEEVAELLARLLGLRLIDYQVIQAAASEAGVSAEAITEAEQSPSLLTRLLESLARMPALPSTVGADPVPLAMNPIYTSTDYRRVVEDVVRDMAERGECLIVGHAANVILRQRPDVLRVLVTGSKEARTREIAASMHVDEKTARETVERADDERRDYFRRFYDTDWLSPGLYDVCISTDRISPELAARLIAEGATSTRVAGARA
ncbi:MAG: cytidylate kinase-like family protein [Dehalococcoidia bacterium]|nr:cytidylate kinase-like family protein [Dehalococcoidia bacterium]